MLFFVVERSGVVMINEKKRASTQKSLEEAFMRVYAKKRYEDITITDICNEAGLYRSTFYNYYRHVGELLDSIENRIIGQLLECAAPFGIFRTEILFKSPKKLIEAYTAIMRTMYENRDTLKILMSENAYPSYTEKYRKAISATITDHLEANSIHLNMENRIVLEYMVAGIVSAQNMWLQTGTMSVEEMAALLDMLNKSALKAIIP